MESVELKFDFKNIDQGIGELEKLKNRALACGGVELFMPNSKGEPKEALLRTHEAVKKYAESLGLMIEGMIEDLELTKKEMHRTDESLATTFSE